MTTHRLVLGDQEAAASIHGGTLTTYRVSGVDVLAGVEDPDLFAFRGSLLAPWPNRVAGGRWIWEGTELSLPVNDTAAGSALHGLVFDVDWTVTEATESAVTMSHLFEGHDGYPFPLAFTVSYSLGADGLACSLTARNTGNTPAPIGLGVHPYVDARGRVEDLHITLPVDTAWEHDLAWRETGRRPVADAGLDFRTPRRLGDLELDAAFTDVRFEGNRTEACVAWPNGQQVVLWSGETCRWWVVYTGQTLPGRDLRGSVAIEPMTCPPDAFNTGEIDVVAPGESLTLTWGLTVR